MGTTSDRNDPGINQPGPNGQNKSYLVLSDEERAKGFVRPVRCSYAHVGIRPTHPTRKLSDGEQERYMACGYVLFEEYPPDCAPMTGRYWTQKQLDSGCGAITTMSKDIAETYAREPKFYGSTFCVGCGGHHRVEEFVWQGTDERVGS